MPRRLSHMSASGSRVRGQAGGVSGEKRDPGRGLWESHRQTAANMSDLVLNAFITLHSGPASTITI